MNNTNTLLTTIIATSYFYILNNPYFIKKLNIKIDNNTELIYYSIIYLLLLYSTNKIINLYYPDKLVEHATGFINDINDINDTSKSGNTENNSYYDFSNTDSPENSSELEREKKYEENIFGEFKKNIDTIRNKDDNKLDNANEEEKTINYCRILEDKIVNTFENSGEDIKNLIKKMKDNPYKYDICKPEDHAKCHKIDMSRFVLKESVPSCKYVLPEQYNLFKKRPGDDGDDSRDDSRDDSIINKNNFVMYYLSFVGLIMVYIIILIIKSIF